MPNPSEEGHGTFTEVATLIKNYYYHTKKRRQNDTDPYSYESMWKTIRNSESPTTLSNRLGQRLRERWNIQLQSMDELKTSLEQRLREKWNSQLPCTDELNK